MTYKKPQLILIETAVNAIQGGKDSMTNTDAEFLRSVPAYQADE